MDPQLMIFILLVLLIVGGFTTVIPLARRLPEALDTWVEHRKSLEPESEELQRLEAAVRDLQSRLDAMEDRVELLAERQDFTERLLEEDTNGPPGRD